MLRTGAEMTAIPNSWDPTTLRVLKDRGVTSLELLRLLTPHQVEVMRQMGPNRATVIMDYCARQSTPLLNPSDSLQRRMKEIFAEPGKVPVVHFYNCGILSQPQLKLIEEALPTLGQLAAFIKNNPKGWLDITVGWSPTTRLKVEKLLKDVSLLKS